MRDEASSDVFKVWLYAGASVLVGAWVSPFLYSAGKALADVSSVKQTNGPLEWLAGICEEGNFPAYFVAALVASGLVFFLPFVHSLKGGRSTVSGKTWTIRLPGGARSLSDGQRLRSNPSGFQQALTGFALVVGLFFMIASVLILAGVFEWKMPGESVVRIVLRALVVAFALAVAQEILFRGLAMGIFLRAMRPAAALGMSAVLFALVHFLNPPSGLNVLDPDASGTGFELLRKIAAQFSEPRVVLGTFAPLLALGGVLAYARWMTSSLWLPVGLHAGWVFVNATLGGVTVYSSHPDSAMWVVSGASFQQGLVPLAGILIAGILAMRLTSRADDSDIPV